MTHHPIVDEICRLVGSRNWVVARRTARIVAHYGDDVVCLSPKRYAEIERQADQNIRMEAMLVGL